MAKTKHGKRHPLILYKDAMDQKWATYFWLAAILVGIAAVSGRYIPYIDYQAPLLPPLITAIVYVGAVISVCLTVYILLTRKMGFVQARTDYVLISVPFFKVKISYRRVRRNTPSQVSQVFPPDKTKNSIRSIVQPYDGKTAVILHLKGYPISPSLLRFFLGSAMLLPSGQGFVLLVPDWMELSTEIDGMFGAWQQRSIRPNTRMESGYGLLQSTKKK
jgi:hypothetical protein